MSDSFPIHSLPSVVRQFVEQCAKTLPCHPDMVALPVIATLGAAIGNSRLIKINELWLQSSAIYAVIVSETGTMKTPVLNLAVAPLQRLQTSARRTWASDTTVERLAELLEQNPKGLLICADELSGFMGSLNQYKNKKGGNDREFFLSCYSGTSVQVDRKQANSEGKRQCLSINRPFVGIVGCIPPALLTKVTQGDSLEDGFVQRFLITQPPSVPVRLIKNGIHPEVSKGYADLIAELAQLDGQAGEPKTLELTDDAWPEFEQWHNAHSDKTLERA